MRFPLALPLLILSTFIFIGKGHGAVKCEGIFTIKKVFVLDPTAWDEHELRSQGVAENYILEIPKLGRLNSANDFVSKFVRTKSWLKNTTHKLKAQGYDAIIGVQDFPTSLLASALGESLGMKVPKLDVMLRLHNKFLSREIQQRAAPEAVPPFALIDLKQIDVNNPPLPYPFFLKPVKGLSSIKAQVIRTPEEFIRAAKMNLLEKSVQSISTRPLDLLMAERFENPIPSNFFIAEGLLSGVQVTVDGFSQNGKSQILGVVDSILYEGSNSFESFQYPSRLPMQVQTRMGLIAKKVMEESGFDHSLFNVEMFYDATTDKITIIEINPRMAYQFADLYEKVDGINLYSLQLQLAAGQKVEIPHRQGAFKTAGSFVPRVFPGQKVIAFPSAMDVQNLQVSDPDIRIRLIATEYLASMNFFQDVESTRLAFVNIGGESFDQMRTRINEIYHKLGIVISK